MPEQAYVSVIEWPGSLDEPARVDVLSRAVGLDVYLSKQAVRRGTPNVVRRMESPQAEAALAAFRSANVLAFAPLESHFDAWGEFFAAKGLVAGAGSGFLAQAWRGDPRTFDAADITVLVRASLRSTEIKSSSDGLGGAAMLNLSPSRITGGASFDEIEMDYDIVSQGSTTRTSVTEIMDLFLQDGSRIRINGDKFGFDVLGKNKGYTDRQNMDRLAVMLSERAPRAVVDLNFREFRCPPDILTSYFRSGEGRVRLTVEAPAFDFYSVWAALMYRKLMPG